MYHYSSLLRVFNEDVAFLNNLNKKLAKTKEGHYPSDETLGVSPHRDSK